MVFDVRGGERPLHSLAHAPVCLSNEPRASADEQVCVMLWCVCVVRV